MTTVATRTDRTADHHEPGTARVLGRTLRAEWARLWSVRTSWLFVLAATAGVVGISLLAGSDARREGQTLPGETAWETVQIVSLLSLFVVLSFAAVSTATDHATGGIVPTLQWTPRRGILLAARTVTVVVTTTLLGVVLACLSAFVLHTLAPVLGVPRGPGADTLGSIAYVVAAGALLAVGLGLLVRSTAGSVVAVLALMLVLPLLLGQFPVAWAQRVGDVLPGTSAIQLVAGEGPAGHSTGDARMILAAWAVGGLALGAARLLRSDANR